MLNEVDNVQFELIRTSEHRDIEAFDYTKATAINTCPTWGITRYGMHKRMPKNYEGARSMALEAGQAGHESYAAIRIAQIRREYPDHARVNAVRLFGEARGTHLLSVIDNATSLEHSLRAVAIEALITGGFHDDPYDRRRTVANLEASLTAYSANYDATRWPVWIADERDPTAPVGIEQPFAVLVTFNAKDGSTQRIRLTGKIDGIHWNKTVGTELIAHENKTSGRINEAWIQSYAISHQVTGYLVAATLFTQRPVTRAVVRGMQLPLPKLIIDGLHDVWVVRDDHHRARWIAWLWHTLSIYREFEGNPIGAPKYSHSCNRYFRPCPMIPFCDASPAEQEQILEEMVTDEWSPLSEEYDG